MIERNGWWWPSSDQTAHLIIPNEMTTAIPWFLSHVERRGCVVQAGGNIGMYPVTLADHFRHVMTVEPLAENYECLSKNVRIRDGLKRVAWLPAAFGEAEGTCRPVEDGKGNCGATWVELEGNVKVIAIDDLHLNTCDAIWLDVEGFELFALKGALQTIRKHRPVIVCEEKGLGGKFGVGRDEIEDFLFQWGYAPVDKHGADRLYKADL